MIDIKNIINIFLQVIDNIARTQTSWNLIVFVFTIALLIYYITNFRRKINQKTMSQIVFFKNIKKYDPSLYIELNRNMENLRYFIMSYKWKHRLIRQYNRLFVGYDGKRLKNALGSKYQYRLSYFSKISTIRIKLTELNDCFSAIREDNTSYLKTLGDYFFIMRNLSYDYLKITEHMLKICTMIEKQSVVIVGSAGNGKTNIMCRLSEFAIANKIPVLLINARDINQNCVEYIYQQLPGIQIIKRFKHWYLRLVSLQLFLQRKHFYVLIDAINENDIDEFRNSIKKVIDCFSKHKRVRILLSCRSEYFETRFKNYFEHYESNLYVYNLMCNSYDERATKKMFQLYSDQYNVNGILAPHAKRRLLKSLFLMKIFFEVNQNKTGSTIELRNAEIYSLYVKKVNEAVTSFGFSDLIDKVAKAMLGNSDYRNISLSTLNLSTEETQKIVHVLDDNLIISRTVQKGTGITKRTDQVVYFVFDELRDFCLARYLLTSSEEKNDATYAILFEKANEMYTTCQSPIEGILKYSYYYFKNYGDSKLSEKILTLYGETGIQEIVDSNNRKNRIERVFNNFGLSLIFIDGGEISEFEIKYIKQYINKHESNYWHVFWHLLPTLTENSI